MSEPAFTTLKGKERALTPLLIAVVAIIVIVMYASSVASVVELWSYSEYRHGALVLPISAYLLWRARGALANVDLAPWWPGLPIIACLVAIWWGGRLLDVQVLEQMTTVLLIPAAVATALGFAVLRRVLFPLLFLVAAVPTGDGLLPYLMVITADISTALLKLTGMPVYRDGQFISLPGGNFEVADVCAGLNYLVSGIMISALFAYLTYRGNLKRIAFVGVAALSLVVANGLRAFIVMYVASASEMRYLAGRDHVWFGWVLFGLVIVALFLIGSRWADQEEVNDSRQEYDARARSRATLLLALVLGLVLLAATAQRFQADIGSSWKFLLPAGGVLLWVLMKRSGRSMQTDVRTTGAASEYGGVRATAVLGSTVLLLAAGPIFAPERISSAPAEASLFDLPPVPSCSEESSGSITDWQEDLPTPSFGGVARFQCLEGRVTVVVAGFWGAGPGREVHLLMPTSWRSYPVTVTELPSAKGVTVNEVRLPGRLVWFWYRVGDRIALSPIKAKMLLAFEMVKTEEAVSGLLLLETTSGGSSDIARRRLSTAADALIGLPLPSDKSARLSGRISAASE